MPTPLVADPIIGFSPGAVTGSDQEAMSALIGAFESARADGPVDLAGFLPAGGDSRRVAVLVELIRIDLEMGWTAGLPTPLAQYQRQFPEAFRERSSRQELAFEDYRQRLQAGR